MNGFNALKLHKTVRYSKVNTIFKAHILSVYVTLSFI